MRLADAVGEVVCVIAAAAERLARVPAVPTTDRAAVALSVAEPPADALAASAAVVEITAVPAGTTSASSSQVTRTRLGIRRWLILRNERAERVVGGL